MAPIEPKTPTEVAPRLVTPKSRQSGGFTFDDAPPATPSTPPPPERSLEAPRAPARPGFVRRRSFSRSPAGLVATLTPEQTRSLSSSFAAFNTEMKPRATRSPCSPLNDGSPVPTMPRLLGKRPRS